MKRVLLGLLLAAQILWPAKSEARVTIGPHAAQEPTGFVTAWATTLDAAEPENLATGKKPRTQYETVDLALSGTQVRLRFSNILNVKRLDIVEASIASVSNGKAVGKRLALSFGRRRGTMISPGEATFSDPMKLLVRAGDRLSISFTLRQSLEEAPLHDITLDPPATSDSGESASGSGTRPSDRAQPWRLVDRVLVNPRQAANVAIAIGDSLTDGDGDISTKRETWPWIVSKTLSERLIVLNLGRAGSRLERDGLGISGLKRLRSDGLTIQHLKYVFLEFGLNDLGFPGVTLGSKLLETPARAPSGQELERAFTKAIAMTHQRAICVVIATLPPFHDADFPGYFSEGKESARQQLNAWIRHAAPADAVMDIDESLRDPTSPTRLREAFKSRDGLHPNRLGQKVMAQTALEAFNKAKAKCG
ncbi:MAG: GDSL-type esterase/lipase family protein [Pseudomonadota bacterium]|uniref:GDSL-type esterase/lipase family protein n=1 Tax=Sphingomonas sp. ERG5 TaxID=1381597 RepID=UPI00054BBA38|nr:GDSL-type esterase/lipase family protein [Sphingomonas sp. ERG5]